MKRSFQILTLITCFLITILTSCKNEEQKEVKADTKQEDKKDTPTIITNTHPKRNYQTKISKQDIIGTWKSLLDGSRTPDNHKFYPNGSWEYGTTKGKWAISNDQLIFSNEFASLSSKIDGSYMKITVVSKKGGEISEMEAIKINPADEEKEKLELINKIEIRHKYSYVNINEDGSKLAGLLELYGTNDFTQAVTINGYTQSGRGTFKINGDKLTLNRTSGIAVDGVIKISIGVGNKIWLTLSNGVTYVEDDNMSYIKNMRATPS